MSTPSITPQQAAELLLKRRRARDNFTDFCRLMQPEDQQPMPPHRIITDALDWLEKTPGGRLMLLCPPGLGKSSYASGLFPAYFMGKHPDMPVIFGTHTADFSKRWGRRVRNLVSEDKYRQVFNDVAVASDSAAADQWSTNKGGEYLGIGVGGRVQGRRAELLIIDDPIGSKEDAESQTTKDSIDNWFTFDLSPRLKPQARICLIQTRYSMDDLAGRLLEREGERWRVIKLKMECEPDDKDDPLGRQPGERIWPEYFTQQMVDDAKRDPRTWTSLYQQSPVPLGGGEFKRQWVQFYEQPNFTGMPKIILVDPAGGRNKEKSDFTAMWVLALGEDNNVYVVDIIRDRLDLGERTERLFSLHRKYRPVQVRYEQYGMQSDIEHIKSEQNKRNYRFPITEVGGTRISKHDRIRRLIPYFRDARMWFPHELIYTDYSGRGVDLVRHFIESELCVFPVAGTTNEDMLDALSRLAEPNLSLPWPSSSAEFHAPVLSFGVLDESVGY